MTLKDFITKYNGKKVERYDSSNKDQCVDLFLAYLDEVLGLSSIIPIGIGPAYDIYNKTHKFTPHSTKHQNTKTFIPRRGDVVVWSSKYGPAGHVAIITEADINRFKAYSQNDPIGSPCVIKEYSYTNVLGFLTPNNLPDETMADYYKGLDLTNKDSMKVAVDEWYNVSQGMYVKAEIVAQKDTMIENLNRELKSCSTLRETDTTTIKTLKDIIREQEKEIKKLEESLSTRVKEVEELSLKVSRLNGEVIKAREERNTAVEEAKKEYETTHIKLAKSEFGKVVQRFIVDFESYWNERRS